MSLIYSKKDLQDHILKNREKGKTIGFVPTMGALHNGHASLISFALKKHAIIVVSIFVNPTQFNNAKDLKKYPRSLVKDTKFLSRFKERVIIYAPSVQEVYGNSLKPTAYNFRGLEHVMEGEHRPGHFDGVGTVLNLLFRQFMPDEAFFGEKDYQQFLIVKKLVQLEKLTIKITGCPIHRQTDGLAMSSRNKRLSPEQLKAAPFIYKSLQAAKQKFSTMSALQIKKKIVQDYAQQEGLELEYFEIANIKNLKPLSRKHNDQKYRAFIAVFSGEIRLIDNIALN